MSAPLPAASLSEDETARLTALVREFSGLHLGPNREAHLCHATGRACAQHGVDTVASLVELLARPAGRAALEEFVASLTIGETHFFRTRPQLHALRSHVLPELIARRSNERRLTLWSAGCSTGEEAYTLAMLVDMVLPRRDGWDISILGTDIDRRALERAERAIYGSWSFRQVSDDVVRRYFVPAGRDRQIIERIRQMVAFRSCNLVQPDDPGWPDLERVDLILCRNVLIYFPQEAADAVVSSLAARLAPGGWLVAGHAESPMPILRDRLEAREFPMAMMFRRPEPPAPSLPVPTPVTPVIVEHTQISKPEPDVDVSSGHDDTDAALPALHAAAERDTSDPTPLLRAAKILASTRRLDVALHTVGLALDRDALCADGHYLQGLILRELGRQDDALTALRRAVYLEPAFALGHYTLGEVLVSHGQLRRGERAFAAAVEAVSALAEDDAVNGGDGLTVGGLMDLVVLQRQMMAASGAA